MVSVILPFLASMLLGRTINLKTYNIEGDIYDSKDYSGVPLHVLNSTYNILDPHEVPYNQLKLPADFVLRIKSNRLRSASGAAGLDGLLKTTWKSKSTVIAISTVYQTTYKQLKEEAQLLPQWTQRIPRSQTHYAAAATYGGWNSVMYQVICSDPEGDEIVKKILKEKLGDTGTLSEKTIDHWRETFDTIKNHPDLKNKVNFQVKMFSSHPFVAEISKPERLWYAILKFVINVEKEELPLFLEFKPLHKLDSRFPSVQTNDTLDKELKIIDEMFDDLRYTEPSMRKWLSKSLTEFTKQQEEKVLKLFTHLSLTFSLFDSVAGNASIYNPMDANIIKSAMLMYHRGLTKQTESYQMLFLRLKEDLDPNCEDTFQPGVKGLLMVAQNEKIELGEMVDDLEECKKECIEEPKCRAVGYADKMSGKKRQCFLFFRSSQTTTLIPVKAEQTITVYDRKCY